jgi:TAG lipase/steryl ester hydrolase/phospholipase A2/LPA acyltransferase
MPNIEGFFERSSFFRRVKRFVTQGTILDVNILKATIRGNIGEMTFLEAYERTGRIINISVTPASKNEYPTLLNYLTAPHVLIWSACLASCAIPYVFDSIALMAKDKDGNIEPYYPEGLKWQDGSLEYDLPMTRLSELFNVNHFIVSQVNPHVIPFSTIGWQGNLLTKLIHYLKAELKHYGANIASLGLPIPGISFFAIFTQKYEGDITIKPLKTNFKNFQGLLSNPTRAKVAAAIREGERKTWRHLSMIRNHCDIEFTLNECVNEVKRQLYQRMEQEEDPTKKRRVRRIRRESWMRRRGSSVISFMDEPRPK